jgi:DNA-binding MarR family transcriptional regulator
MSSSNPLRKHTTDPQVDRIWKVNNLLRLLDEDITPIAVSCLLYVMSHDNCHKQAMEMSVGLSTASGSRNTDFLSATHRLGKPGLGLITKELDATNRRRQILSLTDKGRRLAEQLKSILYE